MRPNSYSPISIQNQINLSLLSKNDIIDQKWPKCPKIIKMETLDRGRILAEMNLRAENMRTQDDPFDLKNRREKSYLVRFEVRTWSLRR